MLMKSLVLFCLTFNLYAHLGDRSDSGIYGKPYKEIVQDLRKLAEENPEIVSIHKYGESIKGKPLIALRIKAPLRRREHKRAVLISGSIHGNEYLNIADRLPAWFVKNARKKRSVFNYLSSGGVIYIAPILNPDGYDRRSRYNAAGADLNRDFTIKEAGYSAFKHPETKQLTNFLHREVSRNELKLEVTVDYHCCDGSLLYPWSYKKEKMPESDLVRHVKIGELMKEFINPRYRHGITGEVLGYYPLGTSKDYYYERYRALAFTFEGAYRKENKNFDKHTEWWSNIFKFLLKRKRN